MSGQWQPFAKRPQPTEQVKVRSCNRHSNCEQADVEAKARGTYGASHCHDDDCEDCFGC